MNKLFLATAFALFCAFEARPCGGFCGGFRPPPPPCGLPPYIDDLPEDARLKITEIWKNYKAGDKCYNEQGLTREIVDALPKDAKKNIHRFRLPFLHGLPSDVVAKFDEIMKDRSLTFDEKKEKTDALAKEILTGDALQKFNEFKERMKKHEDEYEEKKSKLSKEAFKANEKISKLMKEKFEIMGSLSEEVKDELFELWKSRFPGPPPPPQ
ncbi:unnamed protein product [Caenorhabditis bovis]|uniref:SXP/RAL-2 family protein Ani s 5-like cation-binding domain-containing protein n=1 Tax=Caenorhabditis bovis TaxID=2654633 RepID=A0A8S1ETK7_9PELO|nr:unnamed protein product [Caenorhabditis bovis]